MNQPAYPPFGQPPQQPAQPQYPPQPGYPPAGQPPAYPQPAPPAYQPQQPAPQPSYGGSYVDLIAGAQAGNKGGLNFIGVSGKHVVDIERVHTIMSNQGEGELFIVELVVVESNAAEITVGDKRSWLVKLRKPAGAADALRFNLDLLEIMHGPAFSPIKAAYSLPPAQRPAGLPDIRPMLLQVGSEQNPCRGMRFALDTWDAPQKTNKNAMFTQHVFSYLGPASEGRTLGLGGQQQRQAAPTAPAAPAWGAAPPASSGPAQTGPTNWPPAPGGAGGWQPPGG